MSYTHLAREERYQIAALFDAGKGIRSVAQLLGRSPATITRERRRNSRARGRYRAIRAHRWACRRQRHKARGSRISAQRWREVRRRLQQGWSPEQIAGRLALEARPGPSHERIYQHVRGDRRRGGELYRALRCQKGKRKRYAGGAERRGRTQGPPICTRPAAVAAKRRYGD